MKRIALVQLDGKIPNLALMRLSHYHKAAGDEVLFFHGTNVASLYDPELIYVSLIFERSRPLIDRIRETSPFASLVIGGTGYDYSTTLEQRGIGQELDYSIYPGFRQSIGFSQRGCRLKCEFCVVPKKEGSVKEAASIHEIWRGDPWPKEVLLLDNDFFGAPRWRDRIAEIRDGRFKVSFNQGINARCLTDEAAEAIASVDYRADDMETRRIYTAWDSREDEDRLFAGLNRLVKYGVKPDHIMVYMLIGYWPGETAEDRDYRRKKLRDFGARPYPMPFIRNQELVGFQRWIIRAYDKRWSWKQFADSGYDPRKLGPHLEQEIAQ